MRLRTQISTPQKYTEELYQNLYRPIAQKKLDGFRCRAVLENGTVTLFSSTSRVITSVPHIQKQLADYMEKLEAETSLGGIVEFDGELYSHTFSFQKISSIVSRSASLHPEYRSIIYHIYDIIQSPLAGETESYTERNSPFLINRLSKYPNLLRLTDYPLYLANSASLTSLLYSAIKDGFEGLVIKDMLAAYERKLKTKRMLKIKIAQTGVFKIIGWKEQVSKEGKPKQLLGALKLALPARMLKEGKPASFFAGSGFMTQEDRAEYYRLGNKLLGGTAEIRYQSLSQSNIPLQPVIISIQLRY